MSEHFLKVLNGRYKSGYSASNFIVTLGVILKVVGIIIGILYGLYFIIVGLVLLGDSSIGKTLGGTLIFIGLFGGALNALVAFVVGTAVSAFGELLRAIIDSAVNTSPLVNDDEKAEIMGLVLKEPITPSVVTERRFNYEKLQQS